jgi:hypothetical protein
VEAQEEEEEKEERQEELDQALSRRSSVMRSDGKWSVHWKKEFEHLC